jgi:uncharacterized glyoxalase superfamily protein PhnB
VSTVKPSIVPVFRYNDARAAIDWLIQAFGFRKHAEHEGPNGTIAHAELTFGPSVVGISSAAPPTSDNPWSHIRQGIYACVPDIDAHYERAKSAGADIVMPIRDMDYGSREYAARDSEGHIWSFGTYEMARGDGAPTLFPELHYNDCRTALAFLERAFGFMKTFEVPGPDGRLVHAELKLGDSALFVGTFPRDPKWVGLAELVCAFVEDPDQHHLRSKAGGATIVTPPTDTPFGARQYSARDPEGFVWLFGTYRPTT